MPTTIYWDVDGVSSYQGTVGNVVKAGVQISYGDGTANAQKMIVLDGIMNGDKYGTDNLETEFDIASKSSLTGITQIGVAEITSGTNTATSLIDPTNGDNMNPAAVSVTYDPDGAGDEPEKTVSGTAYKTGISPLSIDVGTCKSLTQGLAYNMGTADAFASTSLQVAGVVIGLPTLEITTYHSDDEKVISVVTATTTNVANSGKTVATGANTTNASDNYVSNELIRIDKKGVSQMAILGGRIEIAPH